MPVDPNIIATGASAIPARLQAVNQRIAAACLEVGRRPESVLLLAVSKTFPVTSIRDAVAAGQRSFGENYVQEGVEKVTALSSLELDWHFIGPLQSNKTRAVAEHFSWVHAVDRLKIAQRLSAARPSLLPPLNVCLQVNVSGESSKSGVTPDEVADLARATTVLPGLRLRGLMAIPEPTDNVALLRSRFAGLRALLQQLNTEGLGLDTLSMGMSQDLESAIYEGATIVRVGTAIFGARPPVPSVPQGPTEEDRTKS
jgi:PLP dependent protein